MDEFEQSELDEGRNDSHSTCYQNVIRYQEKENAFIKIENVVYFLLSLLSNCGEV